MLVLINANMMVPPVAPIGLDYIAAASEAAGIKTDVLDLALVDEPLARLRDYFCANSPTLVGLSFRNVDDCFWPSARWFVPDLADMVDTIRSLTDAPIVIGGVGFSIFARQIVEYTGVDFGIRGDGEKAIVALFCQLKGQRDFHHVPGLIWQKDGKIQVNRPAWPEKLFLATNRGAIDNATYFKKGGQIGLETKRGCNRNCTYCADALAKGKRLRVREPCEVADEVEALLAQGIDVLHLCDSEFNIPAEHALAVCEEFIRRSFGKRLRWYTYMTVTPFDAELAKTMAAAGCVGVDFTGDSANAGMLKTYRQPHRKEHLASAVRLCRENNIKVMIDLLLGGPGETQESVCETINFIKEISPDCAGASLGVRMCAETEMARIAEAEGPLETNPNIHRKYAGAVDFSKPTFYISHLLGPEPAVLVRDLIGADERFFPPALQTSPQEANSICFDHNYNDNTELVEAIKNGARGAYWDILHQLRTSPD